MDDLFHAISKLAIAFPVLLIIGGLLLKITSTNPSVKSSVSYPTPQMVKQIASQQKVGKNSSIKLNLNGPLTCNFADPSATFSAYIKDKKIAFRLEERLKIQNFLLNGDCLYIWSQGTFSGEKVCGLNKYVQIAENLLSMNLLDFNTIFANLTQLGTVPESLKSGQNMQKLASSCKKEEKINESVFLIPKNVLFKNKEVK